MGLRSQGKAEAIYNLHIRGSEVKLQRFIKKCSRDSL